jgi:polyphosphate kinase
MPIDGFSLNPIFARVFPTFKPGNEWIDLKDDTGKTDGSKQLREVLQNHNDIGSPETSIDDEDIIGFLRDNLEKIPEDKIQDLVAELTQYLQINPKGSVQYDDELPVAIKDTLAVIISRKPQYYLESVENLLTSDDFLVRWAGVDILFGLKINDNALKAEIKNKVEILLGQEEANKERVFNQLQHSDRVLYYPIQDTYDWYLGELNRLITQLSR